MLPLDLCSSEFSLPGPAGQRRQSPGHCQQTTPLPPGRLWKSLMQVAGKFVSVFAVSWASWYAATAAWMVSPVLASQVTRLHKQNTSPRRGDFQTQWSPWLCLGDTVLRGSMSWAEMLIAKAPSGCSRNASLSLHPHVLSSLPSILDL